ncbi:hypothetical protein ACFY9H_30050 [Streptomyces bacillaris]|uniref:hypothetical protein n=1 Tax=Streptomyces bacillaris TaxID=68179 RepID=UPI00345F73E3
MNGPATGRIFRRVQRAHAAFDWADWLFRGWGPAAGIWIHCRLSAWKITADRDGVAIPGLFTVDHIPWTGLGTVVPRRDGCLRVGDRMPGPVLPPFLPGCCAGR